MEGGFLTTEKLSGKPSVADGLFLWGSRENGQKSSLAEVFVKPRVRNSGVFFWLRKGWKEIF